MFSLVYNVFVCVCGLQKTTILFYLIRYFHNIVFNWQDIKVIHLKANLSILLNIRLNIHHKISNNHLGKCKLKFINISDKHNLYIVISEHKLIIITPFTFMYLRAFFFFYIQKIIGLLLITYYWFQLFNFCITLLSIILWKMYFLIIYDIYVSLFYSKIRILNNI